MRKYLLLLCLLSSLYGGSIEDLKAEVQENLPEIAGWCSQEKAMNFIDLVLEVKPQVCVEIGVFSGASIYPVASALKFLGQGIVIAIDAWDIVECLRYLDPDKNRADLKWWAAKNMDHIYFYFVQMLKYFDIEKFCLICRNTSKKAAPAIGPIDILYIDGNHYEKVAIEDVQLYLPKVRPGGYIWFNDAHWSTLQPAVLLLIESCDIVKKIDNGNCILFRKR
jgi:hypothetical protein